MKLFGLYLLGVGMFGICAWNIHDYINSGKVCNLAVAGILFGAALAAIAYSLKD